MSSQETKSRSSEQHEEDSITIEDVATAKAVGEAAVEGAQDSDLDNLLDEIDGLLEENAEEYVKNFIQQGGQ